MPAVIAPYGWEVPLLGESADGPDGFADLATQIAATLTDKSVLEYTPTWTAAGEWQPAGAVARTGTYRVDHGICDFTAAIAFGPATNGGHGDLSIGLPVPARSTIAQQIVNAVLYTPLYGNSVWVSAAMIDSLGGYTRVRPHFPVNNERGDMYPWASVGSGWTGGTSIPYSTLVSSPWSVQSGGGITVHGRYFAA